LAALCVPRAVWLIGWRRLLLLAVPAAAYVVGTSYFSTHGAGPPGRYLVPIVALLAVPLAAVIDKGRRRLADVVGVLAVASMVLAWLPANEFSLLYGYDIESTSLRPVAAWAPYLVAPGYGGGSVTYSAENFYHRVGDLERVGDAAVWAAQADDGRGHLIFGPYRTFPRGNYEAAFVIWGGPSGARAGQVTVDVTARGRPLVERADVTAPSGQFTRVVLEFTLSGRTELEFRALHQATGTDGIAGVDVRRLESSSPPHPGLPPWAVIPLFAVLVAIAAGWAWWARPGRQRSVG
jgi:hypothetical protein